MPKPPSKTKIVAIVLFVASAAGSGIHAALLASKYRQQQSGTKTVEYDADSRDRSASRTRPAREREHATLVFPRNARPGNGAERPDHTGAGSSAARKGGVVWPSFLDRINSGVIQMF